MTRLVRCLAWLGCLLGGCACFAQSAQVVDLPTRAGITQRMLVMEPAGKSSAVVVLMAGGDGNVGIFDNASMRYEANFLVRSRSLFTGHGYTVLVLDTPSDRKRPPYLGDTFRESDAHAADIGAAIVWARDRFALPVWIVGTSRGTQSAAHAAIALTGTSSPDGVVLTSTILSAARFGPSAARPVQEMSLEKLKMPVLVTHHEQDQCEVCPPALLPALMAKLRPESSQLITYQGGRSVGSPCAAMAWHGYNGIEEKVVGDVAAWIATRTRPP